MSFEWIITVMMVALVTAISPGPVNMLAMNAGVNKKLVAGLYFVFGATLGFCALLFVSGMGLQSLIQAFPMVLVAIKWLGMAFIIWIAWRLWHSDGSLDSEDSFQPSLLKGALLQWLNPKAWLVSLSVVGLYAPKDTLLLSAMTGIYFMVCFLSICCWLGLGTLLTRWIDSQKYLQIFNKSLAVVLAISLIYLLI